MDGSGLLVGYDPAFAEHDPGAGHPERPARLAATLSGVEQSGVADAIHPLVSRAATRVELERVHDPAYLDRLEVACLRGAALDPDTVVVPASWAAALRSSGTGLAAADALRGGEGASAFLVVRPPGHHARPGSAMGFCLVNHIAVLAADLAARGERVLIADFDAHHGNGTQEAFYSRGDVFYVSWHEYPLYPGTGGLTEQGTGAGLGYTLNFPFPHGTTGDVYLRSIDEVVAEASAAFRPDWLLISAGFDAHRADPLTGMGLSAGDFALITDRLVRLVPPGRTIAFLEGGYDLAALRDSVAATLPSLLGDPGAGTEAPTSGGPGLAVVDAAADEWRRLKT